MDGDTGFARDCAPSTILERGRIALHKAAAALAARLSPLDLVHDEAAFYAELGHQLRTEREALGFTLETVAWSAGLDLNALARCERGETHISSAVLVRVCGALLRLSRPLASRDVPLGTSWAFRDHRSLAEVAVTEGVAV